MDSDVAHAGDEEAGLDLAGEEALAIQGYGLASQDKAFLATRTPQEKIELAGNAFNGAAAVACFTASMCCVPWGQVFKSSNDEDMSAEEGNEGGEEGEESSICISSPVSTPRDVSDADV